MSDLTPPPDEPIPAQARDRIRAELLETAQRGSSGAPRWVVPAMAAAAVVLVIGVAGWAVNLGGSGDSGAPAGGGPGLSSTQPTPQGGDQSTPSQSVDSSSVPSTAPSTVSSYQSVVPYSEAPTNGTQPGPASCTSELGNVLKGATKALDFPADPGGPAISFYAKGQEFVLCDQSSDTTTVHKALPLTPADDVATYAVSSSYDGERVSRIAGGALPAGTDVRKIVYTFPNGHQEPARVDTAPDGSTWWRMVYDYDAPGNEMTQAPITVAVFTSGGERDYTLKYGVDTCAQANHGC